MCLRLVIKNKIDGRTIPLVLAGRKLKARRIRRTGLTRVIAKVGRKTVADDRVQENLLKSVSCRFCHADMTLLQNVSVRSGLGSCCIVSCQNEDCLSRTLHFSDHNFLSAFAVRSCNFLIDICMRKS